VLIVYEVVDSSAAMGGVGDEMEVLDMAEMMACGVSGLER
jgi:hypothetical protein